VSTILPHERILVAIDTPDPARIRDLAARLSGRVGGLKIGLEAFTSLGPDPVREIVAAGGSVFLDLKLHDIPNTVAGAAAAAGRLGVRFLTVHALGGVAMMRRAVEAAREGAQQAGHESPRVLAVTILTSHTDDDLARAGVAGPCDAAVVRLAGLAREAGVAGVVCSPLEVAKVRKAFPEGELVVPGIRPAGAALDDQARVATPASAIAAGADRLVIGRPITRADDPAAAAGAIAAEIAAGA
jgi:orotidine-5'-phosphate decarboxylase